MEIDRSLFTIHKFGGLVVALYDGKFAALMLDDQELKHKHLKANVAEWLEKEIHEDA